MTNPSPRYLAIYHNGSLYADNNTCPPNIPIDDRGLLLGDGLFETLPVLNGHAVWWQEHLDRLKKSAALLGMKPDATQLEDIRSQMQNASTDRNTILRITLTRGSGGRGLAPLETTKPLLLATLAPMPNKLAFQDVQLITSNIRRNDTSPTSKIKSLNYLDSILATAEAQEQQAEDALFLNTKDNAVCTTIANLFVLLEGSIITPPVSDGILAGIARKKVMEICKRQGIVIVEKSLSQNQLKKADGLFLTNSLRIIRRVTQLDDHIYKNLSNRSDLIAKLQNTLNAEIGHETGARLSDHRF